MPQWRQQQIAHKKQRIEERKSKNTTQDEVLDLLASYDTHDLAGIETRRPKGSRAPRTFSQPSVISAGDKGIFVTTDIGREKKGLIEISGLVEEYLEQRELLQNPHQIQNIDDLAHTADNISGQPQSSIDDGEEDSDMDIEASIQRELSTLSSEPNDRAPTTQSEILAKSHKPLQLITLDVPCVSFLRFHPLHPAYPHMDPVHITHSICDEAMTTQTPRSRYIRRLSPVSWIGKTLTGGLDKCMTNVLPGHFALDETTPTPDATGLTFAVRPSIRNHDRISRDDIIVPVAEMIASLGQGRHKVDLKSYQRAVLVEVYRGWIGMSVVSNESKSVGSGLDSAPGQDHAGLGSRGNTQFHHGYEALKRFNLAEIYSLVLKD